ncbi:hypothetical protein ASD24_07665 [Paenibacillus sp. Root52]|uniref:Uncharacterized protein n=1 Tax=Paenibacillus amylolyticus TaxID=1451 RepID=A0AAP5H5I1_PAEAM|nr:MULTISPECIES: hypothetical protein [Paenibacillus]KQY87704.1 hypothetical protein ASD24_07665 [Paenibacillus sp. Root52]MDR6725113.1 hypothetical protein [Paenibacillus amylolyticus]
MDWLPVAVLRRLDEILAGVPVTEQPSDRCCLQILIIVFLIGKKFGDKGERFASTGFFCHFHCLCIKIKSSRSAPSLRCISSPLSKRLKEICWVGVGGKDMECVSLRDE